MMAATRYEADTKIGQGSYSTIYRGVDTKTGSLVALKKMRIKKYDAGLPPDVIRELECNKLLKSENIVRLLDYYTKEGGITLVYEYMPSDLATLLSALTKPLFEAQVKAIMYMLLKSIAYCHCKEIMHRDIKPSNLLIDELGQVKLGDFGLGKPCKIINNTLEVGTRWYKAPELLFGDKRYNEKIDIWAAGCVFAELIEGVPLFPGVNDLDQLGKIVKTLGSPTEEKWPRVKELPDYGKMVWHSSGDKQATISALLPRASPLALDLASKMILYDSDKRLSAKEALSHPYFWESPLPCELNELPFIPRDE